MRVFVALAVLAGVIPAAAAELTVSGTRFLLDGKPFPYTGISFFNAIYNPEFNKSSDERIAWMRKFQRYGINVLRLWAQWDNKRYLVDSCPGCTLYNTDGSLRKENLETLKAIAADADRESMVILLALFSLETWNDGPRLSPEAADGAVAALSREMMPYRNVVFQIWNEHSHRVLDHVKTIRAVDPKRLVTNSPGISGVLGDSAQNNLLDFLSPHTSRQWQLAGRHWEVAPAEIRYLLERYRKPVVDGEPARTGTPKFGGPSDRTYPTDHILQIYSVWQSGAYITYHHDMFQTGRGTPPVPPSGIPDPEYNPYHRTVLEFIALRERYMPPH